MTQYIVTRLLDRVILFHSPSAKSSRNHIRRIEAISDWRYVGFVNSDANNLDIITGQYGVTDMALFKRTGIDVREMTV